MDTPEERGHQKLKSLLKSVGLQENEPLIRHVKYTGRQMESDKERGKLEEAIAHERARGRTQ